MTSAKARFAKSQTVGASLKAKRPMSRLVESEEERWAEDRLLSSSGGGVGVAAVVLDDGRYPARFASHSPPVLARPPSREELRSLML